MSRGFLLAVSVAMVFIGLMFFLAGFLVAASLKGTRTHKAAAANDCVVETRPAHLPMKSAHVSGAASLPSAMSLHGGDEIGRRQRYYPRHLPADVARTGASPRAVPYTFNGYR